MSNSNKATELSDKPQVHVQEETFANTGHLWKLQEQLLSREMCLLDIAFICTCKNKK